MSNFAKWSSENMPNKPIYGVYFASRNKDNQDVPNFKERRKVFLTTRSVDELMPEFKHFINMGQPGEFSRFYISVNSRKNKNSLRDLQQYILDALLDNEILSIAAIQTKAAQKAMNPKTVKHVKYYLTLTRMNQNLMNLSKMLSTRLQNMVANLSKLRYIKHQMVMR